MNEFLKLKWDSTSSPSYLEKQACFFIPDEVLLDSYVYQHLKKRLPKQKKSIVLNNEVNFVPGKSYLPKFLKNSSLTAQQQEICLNAMKLLHQNKNPNQLKPSETYILESFNKLSEKIANENKAFVEYAKKSWENDKVEIEKLLNNLYRYGWTCFRRKFDRYLEYENPYREKCLISMTYNEEESVSIVVNCIQNLLELGTLARFSHPNLKFACRLSAQSLPVIPLSIRINSKLPVSQDGNIRKLLESNDINVVISSSGLKRLLDNTDSKAKWKIPVKIEMLKLKKDGRTFTRKVVFIDKPFLENNHDPLDLKYFSMKRLVKTNFCQYEAFSFGKEDNISSNEKDPNNEREELAENKQKDEAVLVWGKKKKGLPDVIHHNVNYRLWKFRRFVNNSTLMKNPMKNTELNVLVRSKLDGCETTSSGVLQPVIVVPKVELQLQYGANIPTKSELSREWTSLFFRPFSNLYRVRMHWDTAEVVSIEKCTIQKVTSEATSLYQYNPNLGLGMLNNLFNDLVKLNSGNYLLVHSPKNESFAAVWEESFEGNMKLSSEHKNYEIATEIKRSWVHIDLNYILPIHECQKRPPGCFTAKKFIKKHKGMGVKKKKQTVNKTN